MLKVNEIMSRDLYSIDASADLELAAIGLSHRGISGAPVRDSGSGALIGVISKSDLVGPHPNSWRKRKDITVLDVMTPTVVSVYEDDPALHAVREMAALKVHRVVVYDRDGNPVGIVSTMDVVRALAEGALFSVADA